MEDRRTVKTKRAIKKAFLKLLRKKDIKKITVSDLVKLADLGRGTFYLYYRDVYDLLEHIETEVLEEIGDLFDKTLLNDSAPDFLSFMEKTMDYIYENRDVFDILLSSKGSILFLEKLKSFFRIKELLERKRNNQSIETEYDQVEVTFIISGVVGIIQDWVQNGMQHPPKQMAQIIEKILVQNVPA